MIKRYNCGNGEGMFESPTGGYVTFEDHKKLLLEVAEKAFEAGNSQFNMKDQVLIDLFEDFKKEIL